MSRVVIDIETLGFPIESIDKVQQDYLVKFSETEKEKLAAIQKLRLYPTTARIITIGMLNPDTNHGKILFQSDSSVDEISTDGMIRILSGSEKELLDTFWHDLTTPRSLSSSMAVDLTVRFSCCAHLSCRSNPPTT